MRKRLLKFVENLLFNNRWLVVIFFLLGTCYFGFYATKLKVDSGYDKQLPLSHDYIKTFLDYRKQFGGANRLLISVSPKKGTIFTPTFLRAFKEITEESYYIEGVNRSSIKSIFTPNVRFIEIVDGGFTGGNIIPAEFDFSTEAIAQVRENVLKSPIVGRLVANDFSAALISLEIAEALPGKEIDYFSISKQLEKNIRKKYQTKEINIQIIGFAKAVGDIAKEAVGVLILLGLAVVVIGLIIRRLFKSWRVTGAVIFCSLVAVVWNMGILTLLGYGLDPMSILIPFLVFAIGISHGIQMVNGINYRVCEGVLYYDAVRTTFQRLFLPGAVALLSDTIGFLSIKLIDIPMIQELAITASLGVLVLILTNLFLLPVLLSWFVLSERHRIGISSLYTLKETLWAVVSRFSTRRWAIASLGVALLLFVFAFESSQELRIGDLKPGVPELKQNSRYNKDARFIVDKYSIGVDILTVIVESKKNACIDFSVMKYLDDFQWYLANDPNVQSTLSLPQVMKMVSAGWNEGHYKWRELPRNKHQLVQAISSIDTSTGLYNAECDIVPIFIFLKNHKEESIHSVINRVNNFDKTHPEANLRLATGNVGVMAAVNDSVEASQYKILFWIYASIITLCLFLFGSWRATVCIIAPLALVSVMSYALMTFLQIGLKVSTLPVAALGVGIGVDYGIYIFAQMLPFLNEGYDLKKAYLLTLDQTGIAVFMTGITLAFSVMTWVLSGLQFQVDMGILFSFMLLSNMVGALCLLPALASFLFPSKEKSH